MKSISQFFFFAVILIFVTGCTSKDETKDVEIMVSAAASLTDALNNLKNVYEENNENVLVTFNFGSSGKLATQLEQGAPSDLFLSASVKDMDKVTSLGLINEASKVNFTRNALVLITHTDSDLQMTSFEDIDPDNIGHFAVGEPESVPVGRYTKDVFDHLGMWNALKSHMVMGSDVRQVLTHVEMGNADLGVVYSSDAFISDKVKVLAEADPAWHAPIVYPGAVISEAKQPQAAQDFLDFLTSDEGKNVLKEYGFK
ncbi:molybdate ABC transporter substrate-binding protein [Sporosarcina sp. Sa2YVA2]|uniref:Molybdate ABC transporter substrate-binding protein n=1 Tax=Sporosarcina quadrami TaxID=2762234 RepID=A0ABR8U5L4_9BACL|nr:molybdate ABC transporter substrate-binding protein [Sporosarcina quadrami]MBD7983332.1 molybdate ABC transporter substrate-binding protein [Sporosarcina quadrami]